MALKVFFFFRPSEFFRPPKKIPKFLLNDFTHNGKINVDSFYLEGTAGTGSPLYSRPFYPRFHLFAVNEDKPKFSFRGLMA